MYILLRESENHVFIGYYRVEEKVPRVRKSKNARENTSECKRVSIAQ